LRTYRSGRSGRSRRAGRPDRALHLFDGVDHFPDFVEQAGRRLRKLVAGHGLLADELTVRIPFEDAFISQVRNLLIGPVIEGHIGKRSGQSRDGEGQNHGQRH
jgi:hypothetical protein